MAGVRRNHPKGRPLSTKHLKLSPYLLLVLTTLFWSGNFVLARYVRLEVPPVGLSFWRWALARLSATS